eukprot:900734-Prymnesium_polylepis.2
MAGLMATWHSSNRGGRGELTSELPPSALKRSMSVNLRPLTMTSSKWPVFSMTTSRASSRGCCNVDSPLGDVRLCA